MKYVIFLYIFHKNTEIKYPGTSGGKRLLDHENHRGLLGVVKLEFLNSIQYMHVLCGMEEKECQESETSMTETLKSKIKDYS